MKISKYKSFGVAGPAESYDRSNINKRNYNGIICPYCNVEFARIPVESLKTNKAAYCKAHLAKCPAYTCAPCEEDTFLPSAKKQKVDAAVEDNLVTIYKLVYVPENRAVYTGRTKDPERRLAQHASASSKCRLVRNAMRRYGRSKFKIEPIMRCSADDADANESYYIMANNTMYPEGYNLRHGCKAGAESEGDVRVAERICGIIPFANLSDELNAGSEAYADLAEICENLEDCSATEELCRQLLREVHPDKAGDTMYSATEVAAMLNQVRESVKN
jgi:hypothetical protein